MSKPIKPKCTACGGKGWYVWNTGNDQSPRLEFQRCDVCEQYDSDLAAIHAVENAAVSQPELLGFVEKVADLTHEGELKDDGQPYVPSSEEAIAACNRLILEARQLLGTAETCGECGDTVPYLIGCPDGAEICRDCFEAGPH